MIEYNESNILETLFSRRGSLFPKAFVSGILAGVITVALITIDDINSGFRSLSGLMGNDKTQLWSGATATIGFLIGLRTNRAMARFWEGTGLLHQMRGEWFDAVSCCISFSYPATKTHPQAVKEFRHTIVRMMSLCHGTALEEIADGLEDGAETIDTLGLDGETLGYLKVCKNVHNFNRVEVLLHLTQNLIHQNLSSGVLQVPPPILSRVFQTLSRGFVNFLNAKKIVDTNFPFPYAQLILFLLLMHSLFTSLIISCLVQSRVWAFFFTFVPVMGLWCLNFIAIELENPFGHDENDLPLAHFQGEINKCLMMLLDDNADIIPGLDSDRWVSDFGRLKQASMCNRVTWFDQTDGLRARSTFGSCSSTTSQQMGIPQNSKLVSIWEREDETTWDDTPAGVPEHKGDDEESHQKRESWARQASTSTLSMASSQANALEVPRERLGDGIEIEILDDLMAAPAKFEQPAMELHKMQQQKRQQQEQRQQTLQHQQRQEITAPGRNKFNEHAVPDPSITILSGSSAALEMPKESVRFDTHMKDPVQSSLHEFNIALRLWTQLLEQQLNDLSRDFGEMQKLRVAGVSGSL